MAQLQTTNITGSLLVSGSTITGGITGSVSGALVGSFPYGQLTSIPASIVSSSTQVKPLLPNGTVSSSAQVDYNSVANVVVKLNGSSLYTNTLTNTVNANNSLFIGNNAGFSATSADNSTMIGYRAGYEAFSANDTIFIGQFSGYQASSSLRSNFIGYYAGYNAYAASDSNFIGSNAGYKASSSFYSNFIGYNAGYTAYLSYYSNIMGYQAGNGATSAHDSNLFGYYAGLSATNAYFSNFLGSNAGDSATNASYSNFLGNYAGYQASNASYSTLMGYQVGKNISGTSIGSNNIIIGSNITVGDGIANSINLGGIIYATGSYATTTGEPSSVPVATGKVGIGTFFPSASLHVSGTMMIQQIIEKVNVTASAPPATYNIDLNSGSLFFRSASTSANWTMNFRGDASTKLNDMMYNGQSITATVLVYNGTTPYSASAYQIDGATVTPRWQGGTSGSANASSLDAHQFTIIKIASASYHVLGSITKYT